MEEGKDKNNSAKKRNNEVDIKKVTNDEIKIKKSKLTEKSELNEEVHSANAWEETNLGDEDRKKKFLRLMGACNTKHQGRFVIGDTNAQHSKTGKIIPEVVTKDLEKEFNAGLEHKTNRHAGVGFGSTISSNIPSSGHIRFDEDGKSNKDSESKDHSVKDCASSFVKPDSSGTDSNDVKQKYKMNFVKGSS